MMDEDGRVPDHRDGVMDQRRRVDHGRVDHRGHHPHGGDVVDHAGGVRDGHGVVGHDRVGHHRMGHDRMGHQRRDHASWRHRDQSDEYHLKIKEKIVKRMYFESWSGDRPATYAEEPTTDADGVNKFSNAGQYEQSSAGPMTIER